jgi:hypothetical protein
MALIDEKHRRNGYSLDRELEGRHGDHERDRGREKEQMRLIEFEISK